MTNKNTGHDTDITEEYDKKFNTQSNQTDTIDTWTNKPQKLDQIWHLYESLTYEEIINGIKDLNERDIRTNLYVCLLRQHILDNHLDMSEDIVIPNEYDLKPINNINDRNSLNCIPLEDLGKEFCSSIYRKKKRC